MSSDGNGVHATLTQILELTLTHGRDLGRLEGHVLRVEDRTKALEGNVNILVDGYQRHNVELAQLKLTCAQRGKRCSEMRRKLDVVEDTGVHHIAELQGYKTGVGIAWQRIALIVGAVWAVCTTVAGIYFSCFYRRGG